MWKKKLSQCQIDDVITFDRNRPNHILPQKVNGHLVGITFTEPLGDGKDINYLIGFTSKPFEECWDNETQIWFKPTTLSKKIDAYKYFWYLTEDQEVEVLPIKTLAPTPAQSDSDREVAAMISEGNPICKSENETDTFIEPMISFEENGSSFSVSYIVFTCVICKMEHISFEKDKYNLFKMPDSIELSRLKEDVPGSKRVKGEIAFHCKDHSL